MSELGIVGSLIASHRAKHSHPDRRNFIPQARRLPPAAQVSARLPQLQSPVPNEPADVPNFSLAAPNSNGLFPSYLGVISVESRKSRKRNPHPSCPVPVITCNGNLIVAAALKYPKVTARLPANYLPETTDTGNATGEIIFAGKKP